MHDLAPVLGVTAVFAITAIMLKTWLGHRERITGQSSAKRDDGRLERLEQAVEAIAIEIERVSEGQRFVTKMLSERAGTVPEAMPVKSTQRSS
ncbi:MAG: hypothetical protein ACREMU_13165 [Gemmatimonadaceae bacterium]